MHLIDFIPVSHTVAQTLDKRKEMESFSVPSTAVDTVASVGL